MVSIKRTMSGVINSVLLTSSVIFFTPDLQASSRLSLPLYPDDKPCLILPAQTDDKPIMVPYRLGKKPHNLPDEKAAPCGLTLPVISTPIETCDRPLTLIIRNRTTCERGFSITEPESKSDDSFMTMLAFDLNRFGVTVTLNEASLKSENQFRHQWVTSESDTGYYPHEFIRWKQVHREQEEMNYFSERNYQIKLEGEVDGHISTRMLEGKVDRLVYGGNDKSNHFTIGVDKTSSLPMQGKLSALSADRLYGFSYSNKAPLQQASNVTPVVVFLPGNGDVHISRDGQLLSIQHFLMGSAEIDQSQLPFGYYEVDINIYVNQRLVDSTTQYIYKPQPKEANGELEWALFGGYRKPYDNDINNELEKDTLSGYMVGGSLSTTLPIGQGVSLWSTNYVVDDLVVLEQGATLPVTSFIDVGVQNFFASDHSRRFSSNIDVKLPYQLGSVWANYENSVAGERVAMTDRNQYSIGGRLNLGVSSDQVQSLSLRHTKSITDDYRSTSVDYSTQLSSSGYGKLALRSGFQRYQDQDNKKGKQSYITLAYSIPLESLTR